MAEIKIEREGDAMAPGESHEANGVVSSVIGAEQTLKSIGRDFEIEEILKATNFSKLSEIEKAWVQRRLRKELGIELPIALQTDEGLLDAAAAEKKKQQPKGDIIKPIDKPDMTLPEKVKGYATLIKKDFEKAQDRGEEFSVQDRVSERQAILGDEGIRLLKEELEQQGIKDLKEGGEAEPITTPVAVGKPPEVRQRGKGSKVSFIIDKEKNKGDEWLVWAIVKGQNGEEKALLRRNVHIPDGIVDTEKEAGYLALISEVNGSFVGKIADDRETIRFSFEIGDKKHEKEIEIPKKFSKEAIQGYQNIKRGGNVDKDDRQQADDFEKWYKRESNVIRDQALNKAGEEFLKTIVPDADFEITVDEGAAEKKDNEPAKAAAPVAPAEKQSVAPVVSEPQKAEEEKSSEGFEKIKKWEEEIIRVYSELDDLKVEPVYKGVKGKKILETVQGTIESCDEDNIDLAVKKLEDILVVLVEQFTKERDKKEAEEARTAPPVPPELEQKSAKEKEEIGRLTDKIKDVYNEITREGEIPVVGEFQKEEIEKIVSGITEQFKKENNFAVAQKTLTDILSALTEQLFFIQGKTLGGEAPKAPAEAAVAAPEAGARVEARTVAGAREEKIDLSAMSQEDLKQRLADLRSAYVRAEKKMKGLTGIGKILNVLSIGDARVKVRNEINDSIRNIQNGKAAENIEGGKKDIMEEIEESVEKLKAMYEEAREACVFQKLMTVLDERISLIDEQIKQVQEQEGEHGVEKFVNGIYKGWHWLGNQNLLKEDSKGAGAFFRRAASLRTCVGLTLAAGGLATGGAIPFLVLRRLFSGTGTAITSYDILRASAEAKEKTEGLLKKVDRAKLVEANVTEEEILKRMAAFELHAEQTGKSLAEEKNYKILKELLEEKIQAAQAGEYLKEQLAKLEKEKGSQRFMGKLEKARHATEAAFLGGIVGSGIPQRWVSEGWHSVKEAIWGGPDVPVAPAGASAAAEHIQSAVKLPKSLDSYYLNNQEIAALGGREHLASLDIKGLAKVTKQLKDAVVMDREGVTHAAMRQLKDRVTENPGEYGLTEAQVHKPKFFDNFLRHKVEEIAKSDNIINTKTGTETWVSKGGVSGQRYLLTGDNHIVKSAEALKSGAEFEATQAQVRAYHEALHPKTVGAHGAPVRNYLGEMKAPGERIEEMSRILKGETGAAEAIKTAAKQKAETAFKKLLKPFGKDIGQVQVAYDSNINAWDGNDGTVVVDSKTISIGDGKITGFYSDALGKEVDFDHPLDIKNGIQNILPEQMKLGTWKQSLLDVFKDKISFIKVGEHLGDKFNGELKINGIGVEIKKGFLTKIGKVVIDAKWPLFDQKTGKVSDVLITIIKRATEK